MVKAKLPIWGLLLLLLAVFCGGGMAWAASPSFNDVEGNEKATYISYLASRGILNGFPDGSFKPLEGLTRAEAATLIVKAKNLPINNDEFATFSDVDGHWANHYISTIQSAGLISGFPDNTYRPEQKLTRAEAVSLLLRMSDEIMENNNSSLPSDVDKNHWAATAISNSIESGMISTGNVNFFPENPMTREDLAQALVILLTNAPDLYKSDLTPILKVIKGTVKLTSLGMNEARSVEKNISLKMGDKISTADSSEAEIIFPDGSGILIKPNTELIFKGSSGRAYMKKDGRPGNAIENLELQLDKGKIFGGLASSYDISQVAKNGLNNYLLASLDNKFDLIAINEAQKKIPWHQQSQAKRVKVKVDMPWGVAAIRGTFWSNAVNENGASTTTALTGQVDVTSGGQTVVVGQGQSTAINQTNTPPTPVQPMNSSEFRGWTEQQSWVLNRGEDMTNQQSAMQSRLNLGTPPPPVPNVLNNAFNQVRDSIPAPPPSPSSGSGGSSGGDSKPIVETSKALSSEWIGINHLDKNADPTKIIWAIAIGDLQAGDVVKVYRNSNATTPLAASNPVPSGGDRVIFPVINLDTTEGSLWLTRTSTNKKESAKTELEFKTFEDPAPTPDTAYIMVTNNPGANDVVMVGNLEDEDRIIVYLENNILISDSANEDGFAVISGLNLNANGGNIGIRVSRPGKYLNANIANKGYGAEQAGSDIFAGVPDSVIVPKGSYTSFYYDGIYKYLQLIDSFSNEFFAEIIPNTNPLEIKVTGKETGEYSFTIKITTLEDKIYEKIIRVFVVEVNEDVLTGVPGRIILLGQDSTSFKLEGNFIEPPTITNSSEDKFDVNWETTSSEIIISMNDYGLGSFTLQVTTEDNQVLTKEIDVFVLGTFQLENEDGQQVILLEEDYEDIVLISTSAGYSENPIIKLVDYDSFLDFSDKIINPLLNDGRPSFNLATGLEHGHYLLLVYKEEQPVEGTSLFIIGESDVAFINIPENGARINKLSEIKFSSSEGLNSDKVKMAIVNEFSDGGFGFLQQNDGEWAFSQDEYWLDLPCEKIAEGEWRINTNYLSEESVFYNDGQYIILLKVNTEAGVVLSSSRFIYDNAAPELAEGLPYEPFMGEVNVSIDVNLKMYFIEQVVAVEGKSIRIWEANGQSSTPVATINAKDVLIEDNNWQESTVTITISPLGSNKTYYVEVDPGAFKDLAGNEYAGISGSDTWYFTTKAN